MVGGIIPLRWAQSSRYGGRLRPESAKNLEHHHRIERRTATLRSVRIRKRRVEFRPERLEIHRDPKGLELVTEVAQTLQPIIDIKKTRLVAHRIISHPPTRMESEMLKLGQVFRTVHLAIRVPREGDGRKLDLDREPGVCDPGHRRRQRRDSVTAAITP